MSFEFVIPMQRNDLLRKAGVNQYVVDEVFPVRTLPQKLQGQIPIYFANFVMKAYKLVSVGIYNFTHLN